MMSRTLQKGLSTHTICRHGTHSRCFDRNIEGCASQRNAVQRCRISSFGRMRCRIRTETKRMMMEKKVRYGLSDITLSSAACSSCKTTLGNVKTRKEWMHSDLDSIGRIHVVTRDHLLSEIPLSRHQHCPNLIRKLSMET
jgi:hypothetical protein